MTATRLTRSGRGRFLIGLGIIILMFGFIAIFHSSQTQLDESRQQLLRCEQQQEALNARMQAIIEHKFRLERSLEAERKEHLETRQNFEQKAKEQSDQHAKAKLEANIHYDSLQQRYKLLQKEHGDLVEDCSRTKKSQLEIVNSLETKVKSLQSQLQKVQNLNDKDLEELKAKYETVVQEKDRLEILLKTTALSAENHKKKISLMLETIKEYKSNCEYKPKVDRDMIMDQPFPSAIVGPKQQLPNHPLDKPLVQRSFNEQQLVSPDLYKVSIKLTNNSATTQASFSNPSTQKSLLANKLANSNGAGSFPQNRPIDYKHKNVIINSVENFQIIPKPLVSDEDKIRSGAAESVQQMPPLNSTVKLSTAGAGVVAMADGRGDAAGDRDVIRHALSLANQASTPSFNKAKRSSTAKENINAPPHKPPKQIPLGVAPIPANFEDLLNNNRNEDQDGGKLNNNHRADANNKQDADNNRYANVVDELIGKNNDGEQDTGAHEVKDPDFNAEKNDDNLNNGAEEDNNFFEAKVGAKDNEDHGGDGDDIEVFGMGGHKHNHKGGDDELGVAANALLDGDNLNNEVAGDQGKEQFADGLHIDEGNEEEEDEDDYSNPAARQQEGPAIRN